jgi:hypothetical protein
MFRNGAPGRFEPAAFGSGAQCGIQLNYETSVRCQRRRQQGDAILDANRAFVLNIRA